MAVLLTGSLKAGAGVSLLQEGALQAKHRDRAMNTKNHTKN